MSREMTPAEKVFYGNAFPNLDVDRAVVTGEATSVYNCIAWTVGVDWRNYWPGYTIEEFDTFYRGYGYERASSGPIAAWAKQGDTNQMSHGSVSGSGHGPRWESKCGQGLRFQHGLDELRGVQYGRIVAYYAKSRKKIVLDDADRLLKDIAKFKERYTVELTKHEQTSLKGLLKKLPKDVTEEFESRFRAWKESWGSGYRILRSDPGHVKECDEFVDVAALGPQIIPLVIEKLTDPENMYVLQLYDELQQEQHLLIPMGSSEEIILKGEEFRAEQVVKLFLSSI